MVEQTGTVFRTLELLFEQHIVYEVQIDLLWEVQHGTFDEISGVECHVEVSVKAERLGIKRSEGKVCTCFTTYLQSIHQVIFVESCTDTGQRTDKLISEQRNVVLINIYVFKNFIDSSLHSLFGKKFIYPRLFAPLYPLLFGMRGFTVIVGSKQFPCRYSQDRFSGYGGSIHILCQEVEFTV